MFCTSEFLIISLRNTACIEIQFTFLSQFDLGVICGERNIYNQDTFFVHNQDNEVKWETLIIIDEKAIVQRRKLLFGTNAITNSYSCSSYKCKEDYIFFPLRLNSKRSQKNEL